MVNILDYNRVMVVGNNGSGKSYFSRRLSGITGLPLVHLDLEYWGPNWQAPPREQWVRRQSGLVAQDRWIIEGNHTDTMELRFQRAEAVVLLDINRPLCLLGVLRRLGQKRPDMPQELEERFDAEFFRFLKGVWTFPTTRRNTILALHRQYPDTPFLVLKGRRTVNRLLDQWSAGSLPSKA